MLARTVELTVCFYVLIAGGIEKQAVAQTVPAFGRIEAIERLVAQRVEEVLGAATTRPTGNDVVFTWVSQPGMIRTFGASPNFKQAFPLYSSTTEVFTDPVQLAESVQSLTQWQGRPDEFTDINEPINGRFPVLDPRAASTHQVEGFHFNEEAALDGDRLPMPVSWLYLLNDGTFVSSREGRDDDNPIIARVAYWADDESCKINVNTASEGIPWDVPKVDTEEDRDYGKYQPGVTEYQRHPGHPATTCLSSVLFPNHSTHAADAENRLTDAQLQRIYSRAPSIVFHPRHGVTPEAMAHEQSLDEMPPYQNVGDYLTSARGLTGEHARGFLTAVSEAPEISVHGTARKGLWPRSGGSSEFDRAMGLVTGRHAGLRRSRSDSPHDLTSLGQEQQTYRAIPGYGASLAEKLGVQDQDARNWESMRGYDHLQILISMADYVRQVDLHSADREPFASNPSSGYGQVTALSRSSQRDPVANHLSGWGDTQPHPRGAGRMYTLSEVALVVYQTAEVTLQDWRDNGPVLGKRRGPGHDLKMIEQILANEHPHYQKLGKVFGPEDVGHRFGYLEVGLIPEIFCASHGCDPIYPRLSMRLLHEDADLKLNGIPLALWGNAIGIPGDVYGPILMSAEPGFRRAWRDRPAGWHTWGGSGGVRLMRFGRFVIDNQAPGYTSRKFLPNGPGPLSHFYCQSTVILRDDEPLVLTQDKPLGLLLYDGVGEDVHLHNAVQQFRLRWAQPGESLALARPQKNSNQFSGWTRRIREAAMSSTQIRPASVLERARNRETVVSVHVSHGDYRHAAMTRQAPSELFTRHPSQNADTHAAHALTESGPNAYKVTPGASFSEDHSGRGMVDGASYHKDIQPDFPGDVSNRRAFAPLLDEAYRFPIDPSITRDFDNGIGNAPDGAYINKPDEGAAISRAENRIPYFDVFHSPRELPTPVALPPLRKINSPVAFGSLPSALRANAPWTTLLFRPNVVLDPVKHPHLGEAGNGLAFLGIRETVDGFQLPRFGSVHGNKSLPPDHLWLDLFWMPPTLPAHVNAPGVTRGKVNLNYQMMPFPHIHRSTALHAVLKSERLLAIPTEAGRVYKTETRPTYRHAIDASETLKQFEEKFARGKVFLTESEICEQFLIPEGQVWDAGGKSIRKFWDAHRLTGDNSLERPYSNLYPRLTTKSNVFRLHLRIQLRDLTTGEYTEDHRRSRIVRRTQPSEAN